MNSIDRRSLLLAGLGAAGTGVLAACGSRSAGTAAPAGPGAARVAGSGAGRSREHTLTLTAAPAVLDLGGGVKPESWAFQGRVPGSEVRITAGDTLVAELSNQLPDRTPTSLHWHGVALRNAMDGVPPVTQGDLLPGGTFTYRFVAPDPGTYFFHPHVGVQLDRGLYGPLIVEDPAEPLAYDDEWVVVLDDWLDGVSGTPDEVFAGLRQGTADLLLTDSRSDLLGGDAGEVKYPYHLVNGRVPADPVVYSGKPGRKVRLRIVNAGSDTAYRVALGGHRLTITHTDGYPVRHQEVDALVIGMGERYDVLVTLGDGVFPLVALAEGKDRTGLAVVRTGSGSAPPQTVRPPELNGVIMTASQLLAADEVRLETAETDVTHRIKLSGSMRTYDWAINGQRFDMADPTAGQLLVEEGQRVRLDFINATAMWHPMHLHGHTYQLGTSGPRKDTTIVLPRRKVSVFFDAGNPGSWMLHCHNVYHAEAGMMALVAYPA